MTKLLTLILVLLTPSLLAAQALHQWKAQAQIEGTFEAVNETWFARTATKTTSNFDPSRLFNQRRTSAWRATADPPRVQMIH